MDILGLCALFHPHPIQLVPPVIRAPFLAMAGRDELITRVFAVNSSASASSALCRPIRPFVWAALWKCACHGYSFPKMSDLISNQKGGNKVCGMDRVAFSRLYFHTSASNLL
jgi:hypothetical protein